jgi:hypothetical protein
LAAGGDGGGPQLLGQPSLQRAEHALRAAARLRRRGRDERDAELVERTLDLGRRLFVDTLIGRLRDPVMGAAIGIECPEQALPGDHLAQPLEARHRAFLLDKESRVDLARGIVHRDDQIPRGIRHPVMA